MARARIPVKTRLNKWRLSRVPFPSVPLVNYFNEDPLQNGSVFAPELRQDQINEIRGQVLGNGYTDAVSRWSWVWAHKRMGGSLGMGKTALLGYVTDQVNRDFGHTFFRQASQWLVVYVQVPANARMVAHVLATAIASIYETGHGVSVERRLVGRLRHKVVTTAPPGQYTSGLNDSDEENFADDAWLESQGVDLTTLNKAVADLLKRADVRARVADAFSTCTLKQHVSRYKDDADSPYFRPAYSQEVYTLLLNDIAKIALAAELRHVTIILDDFYYLVRNTRLPDRDALAREWGDIIGKGGYKSIKSNVFNWVAVMHVTTAHSFNRAWEDVSLHNIAPMSLQVGDVITQPGIHLRSLPKEMSKRMLQAYIRYNRVGKSSTSIFPFTDEALDYIVEYARLKARESQGNFDPRNLLEVARTVFVRALLDTSDHAEINLEFVQHVLAGIPLPTPTVNASVEAIEAADEAEVAPTERRMPLSVVCACDCHVEDGVQAHDLVALIVGSSDERATERITSYTCLACNSPASPA